MEDSKPQSFTVDQIMPRHQPKQQQLNSQKTLSMEQHSQPRTKGKLSAGLKDLSLKVMEQVIKDGETTYSKVASQLI